MAVGQAGQRVVTMSAANDEITGMQHVRKLLWVKPTTIGHDIVVTNSADDVIWQATAEIANGDRMIEFEPCPFYTNGVKLGTVDSGTLLIYLK